jgi:hypothetical protein
MVRLLRQPRPRRTINGNVNRLTCSDGHTLHNSADARGKNVPVGPAGPVRPVAPAGPAGPWRPGGPGGPEHLGPHRTLWPARSGHAFGTGRTGGANRCQIKNIRYAGAGIEDEDAIFAGRQPGRKIWRHEHARNKHASRVSQTA